MPLLMKKKSDVGFFHKGVLAFGSTFKTKVKIIEFYIYIYRICLIFKLEKKKSLRDKKNHDKDKYRLNSQIYFQRLV